MATYTIPAGTTDGSSSLRIGVQAMDAGGRTTTFIRRLSIRNVAPTITSTPDAIASVGAAYIYAIMVDDPGGDLDPLTYELVDGPDRMVIGTDGRLTWTPNDSEVTLPGETVHIEIRLNDGDGGEAMQAWELTVSPNRAPSRPVPVFPVDIALLETRPRLVTQNSADPDFDRLSYFFEIDTVDTFDSPMLQQSGEVSSTPGFTAWQPAELVVGQAYVWRVWAFDGTVETEPSIANFQVVPLEMPVDGGPGGVDAGPGVDAGGGGGGGGGCTVGGGRAQAGAPALLLLTVAALLLRRLRRRRGCAS
jgi:hypothetical protein